ncbi:hypothetical protein [Hornefia butyriciproducens]|uniref:hypothetical protein n=1 Tax=Hornefia butyriciproducens TaxID=2652293 RepID=UPI003F8B036E
MEIIRENNKIKVKSPYNTDFVRKAHELNGKWNNPYWVFREETAESLNSALVEIYGEGFEEVPRVAVEIDLDAFEGTEGNELRIGGVSIAYRPSRDSQVRLAGDTFVKSGGFLSSGGSRNYPEVTWKPGTILVSSVPETVTGVPGVKVVDPAEERKSKLEVEKERLLKRLAEIDATLANL